MKSRPTQPLNAFSMFILTVCSLLIVDDMKSLSNCSQVTLCGVKKTTLPNNKLSLSTKKSHHNLYSDCTLSKITHVFEAQIELQTPLRVKFKGHDLKLASHKKSSFRA